MSILINNEAICLYGMNMGVKAPALSNMKIITPEELIAYWDKFGTRANCAVIDKNKILVLNGKMNMKDFFNVFNGKNKQVQQMVNEGIEKKRFGVRQLAQLKK